jgi:hypothetical protein
MSSGEYREFHRDFRDGRDIRTGTSQDFLHGRSQVSDFSANVNPGRREGQAADVKDPVGEKYPFGRVSELYTNQIAPYYHARICWASPHDHRPLDGIGQARRVTNTGKYGRMGRARRNGRDRRDVSQRDRQKFSVWPNDFCDRLRTRDSWFYTRTRTD